MDIANTVTKMVSPDADAEQIQIVIELATSALLSRFKRYAPDAIELPDGTEYMVVEVAIARFNRIASEGLRSESIEGDSATFEADLTEKYDFHLRELAEKGSTLVNPGRIRAL